MKHMLKIKTSTFDQDNTFKFAYKNFAGLQLTSTGYLFHDSDGDKIYVLQCASCIKAKYTDKDVQERDRLAAQVPVRNGDIAEVNGKEYNVVIVGDYSDAGFLVKK